MSAPETPKPDTKEVILDAALQTVHREGIVGASARAIAKTGDFNQALVFYHFGSVEELLLAALQRANDRRMERMGSVLAEVNDLSGLVDVAVQMHGGPDDLDSNALSAIVAGWSSASTTGARVLETLHPWNELVEGAVERALANSPFRSMIPAGEVAYLMSALFLGIEMFSRLDPTDNTAKEIFESLQGLANTAKPFL